jgi:UDP-glucose 4-epimerase
MARCLVLGANGFIGSHLVDSLVASGHQVRAFGRFGSEPLFAENENTERFYGDFLNRHDLREALKDIEYVFHFISTTTPATAENDPLVDIETNIRMSVELFQECVDAKVKRVIFASTGGAIYGNSGKTPFSEDDAPAPISPYAIGKLSIEHYLHYFSVKFGLDSIALRISNPYGERQPLHRKQGVIPIFIENILQERPLTVQGDGTMIRDYIYVKDATSMIATIFDKPAKHHIYNIGSGRGITVNELVSAIDRLTDKEPQVTHVDAPPTFIQEVVLDTARFADEFHLVPTTSLEDGLKATFDFIRKEITADEQRN